MARLFGTDGVRGLANRDVTAELALALGASAARVLTASGDFAERRPRAVIGRDTRISGEFLSSAVAAGLASAGVDVTQVGVLPTPGVAHLTASTDVDLGVVISASHNPMPDNGIKFFARGGFKLDDAIEDQIEAGLAADWERPVGGDVGRITVESALADRNYIDHLVAAAGTDLRGVRIAVDCANGAASDIAPLALREAGADVVVINASPDGRNINRDCGSTHPEQLQAVTVASGAAFGVAYDGDADRCLAVDHTGALVDGDQILGLLATAMQADGTLAGDTLVVTVMSNLGLLLAMKEAGIATVQTGVGDRYVLEAMRAGGYTLGGEQSGHIINAQHATTGDGVLTSLLLAAQVVRTGRTLADLAAVVTRLPQVLVNVAGVDKNRAASDEGLADAVAAVEAELGETGRVLLRPSGTEPLVRVMVEAGTQEEADSAAHRLAGVVRDRLAL
ncbi:phosphoglucosamine mutase [Georgenia ruanii]|uniref:Phosphoglucosamine mutase n=1 Tax=Georgenia ruanii TaxID=348442 RepID=A0A7J9UT04_9MICO|nr:phosphoglucosamine mutase [Georgenia ruanii]MPV87473.1 phosphoglucosamine mutase [Georgenia ruanii]